MFDFIPVAFYKSLYIHLQLVVTLFVFVHSFRYDIADKANLTSKKALGIFLLVVTVIYAGFRPISYVFGDMGTYARVYEDFQVYNQLEVGKDFIFYEFMRLCAQIMPATFFFFLCFLFYTYPLYILSRKLFEEYWFYSFFILLISLSFWTYGTNGIRNGLASSLFLLAITRNNKVFTYILFFVTVNVHHAMIIPIVMYFITMYYQNTKTIFAFWLMSIPLSLVLGGVLQTFFISLGMGEDEKLQSYLIENDEYQQQVSATGFRWDFLLYSATGVASGLYFILKRKFEDVFYIQLVNMYLLTNAIWILVIRANFSNRFAYLSWFMLGLVIIYPFLKFRFFDKQHRLIGKIIVSYFLITYVYFLLS